MLAACPPKPAHELTKPSQALSPPAKPTRAPVVVAMVVDQLSAWVAAERFPLLPADGGFARVRREGTWVKNLRYPYALTDTAPGHAALHTGRVPAESGIFGNELPDATSGNRFSFLIDDRAFTLTASGPTQAHGPSAARLKVDTVADRLRAAHPDALIVSVAVKDRGAIMPGGQHPSYAIWFDGWLDHFVTSTAFASSFPPFVTTHGGPSAITRARATPWTPSDEAWLRTHAPYGDDAPGEGDLDGMGTVFPHKPKGAWGFRGTPASDAIVFDLAFAAVERDYDPSKPTLVLVSISSCDVIGHVFGPDSWEAWDHLYKLDRALGAFLDRLEQKVGAPPGFLLSADHGNVSMPEARAKQPWCKPGAPADPWERPCGGGKRVGPNATRDALKAEAKKVLGKSVWIAGIADPYVYLTLEARNLPEDKRAALDAAVRRVFAATEVMEEVFDVRDLRKRCPEVLAHAKGVPARAKEGESVLTLVCRSIVDASVGGGDYYAIPKRGSFFDGELAVTKGTSHGTPWLYDRTVPMLARGAGAPRGVVIEDPVDFTAYAAIEAALLGLDPRPPSAILEATTAR